MGLKTFIMKGPLYKTYFCFISSTVISLLLLWSELNATSCYSISHCCPTVTNHYEKSHLCQTVYLMFPRSSSGLQCLGLISPDNEQGMHLQHPMFFLEELTMKSITALFSLTLFLCINRPNKHFPSNCFQYRV